MKNALFVSGSI